MKSFVVWCSYGVYSWSLRVGGRKETERIPAFQPITGHTPVTQASWQFYTLDKTHIGLRRTSEPQTHNCQVKGNSIRSSIFVCEGGEWETKQETQIIVWCVYWLLVHIMPATCSRECTILQMQQISVCICNKQRCPCRAPPPNSGVTSSCQFHPSVLGSSNQILDLPG